MRRRRRRRLNVDRDVVLNDPPAGLEAGDQPPGVKLEPVAGGVLGLNHLKRRVRGPPLGNFLD
jgi:hypothetical protein